VLIEDTTISDNLGISALVNRDRKSAGGISNSFGIADLEIVRSTISGNTDLPGTFAYSAAGGVLGNATIDNATISSNTVVADHMPLSPFGQGSAAGGFLATVFSTLSSSIDHSTVAFNKVVNVPSGNYEEGGGVTAEHLTFNYGGNTYAYEASVTVHNTIIAKNQSSPGDPDVAGAIQSQGHNLVGVLGSGASGFVASDLSGTPSAPLDPRLMPLGWYGGPTQTLALVADSPAINAGDNTNAPPTDQRGDPRIVGGTIDIGSVERNAADAQYGTGSTSAEFHRPDGAAGYYFQPAGQRADLANVVGIVCLPRRALYPTAQGRASAPWAHRREKSVLPRRGWITRNRRFIQPPSG
jgi:hypothetical protein